MKKVTRYVCDHCGYTRATKKTVEKHEKMCFKNPATKSCATCANLCRKPEVVCVNGKVKINDEHYKQMKLPENIENLKYTEVIKLPDYSWDDERIEKYHGYRCMVKGCIPKLTTQCNEWEDGTYTEDDSCYDEMSRHQFWYA